MKFIGKPGKALKLFYLLGIMLFSFALSLAFLKFDGTIFDIVSIIFLFILIGLCVVSFGYKITIEDSKLCTHILFFPYQDCYDLKDVIEIGLIFSWVPVYLLQVGGRIKYLHEIKDMNKLLNLIQTENPDVTFDSKTKKRIEKRGSLWSNW